jgi:glyoxylase-like metal-dependent hydrolase (beta-lactamase superfamily II)
MANPHEAALRYPFDSPSGETLPPTGSSLEVAGGVRWLRMPLPFALDHINLWLLHDEVDGIEGWTIVDCGVANPATQGLWQQVFESELQGLPVLRVIVTHMHPDHIGLAHWLCERWTTPQRECRLWISATDWNAARVASQATTGFGGEHAARFFALHGLQDGDALEKVRGRSSYYANMVPMVPRSYVRLLDGMVVRIGGRPWRCIAGYGHAPEHMALHCSALDVLIAGDMVLPRISTNVSVIDIEPQGNPLPLYLDSIARLASCCRRHAGAAVARQALRRAAPARGAAARPPRRTLRGGAGRLCRCTTKRGRHAAGALQAHPRLAPDNLRDGRGGGAHARVGGQGGSRRNLVQTVCSAGSPTHRNPSICALDQASRHGTGLPGRWRTAPLTPEEHARRARSASELGGWH